jgi:hypothetical protein
MNERIKQLWEDNDTIEVCYPEQGSPVSVSATTLKKFAELIVKECANVADISFVGGWADPGHQIKRHFGVEE